MKGGKYSFKIFGQGGNMTNKLEIYKCEICGNIVQVFEEGAGELVCCGSDGERALYRIYRNIYKRSK